MCSYDTGLKEMVLTTKCSQLPSLTEQAVNPSLFLITVEPKTEVKDYTKDYDQTKLARIYLENYATFVFQ